MEYTACDKNMRTRMYKTVMRADILPCAAFVFLSSSPMLRLMREEITVLICGVYAFTYWGWDKIAAS